jgi:hypothetical protein
MDSSNPFWVDEAEDEAKDRSVKGIVRRFPEVPPVEARPPADTQ